jgi:isopenicillin-N N-acyltransferase-like protein
MLYGCASKEEVLDMWEACPVCSSANTMIAAPGARGGTELFDVEATPKGFAQPPDLGEGFLVHTNHFLAPRFRTAATDLAALPDSFLRLERMAALLRPDPAITVAGLKAAVSDHHDHPCGICRHEESDTRRMATVAGLIAEPAAGRLHVSRGNPCRGDWTCYDLEE